VSATIISSKYNSKKHKNDNRKNTRYNTENDAIVVTEPHVSMNGA
jgi:hypothetical protein